MSMTLNEINTHKHELARQMKHYKAVVLPNLHLQLSICKVSINNITKHSLYKNRSKYYYLGKLATKAFEYIEKIDTANKEYYALRDKLKELKTLTTQLKSER